MLGEQVVTFAVTQTGATSFCGKRPERAHVTALTVGYVSVIFPRAELTSGVDNVCPRFTLG